MDVVACCLVVSRIIVHWKFQLSFLTSSFALASSMGRFVVARLPHYVFFFRLSLRPCTPCRQISEVSSITHAGYLFKRSNKPYPDVIPFPLHSLEIAVDNGPTMVTDDQIMGIESLPILQPKPLLIDDVWSRSSLATFATSNGDNHQLGSSQHRPLNLLNFYADDDHGIEAGLRSPMSPPLAPLLNDITGSISSKGDDFQREDAVLLKDRQANLEEALNSAAAFFGINVEAAFPPAPVLPPVETAPIKPTTSSSPMDANRRTNTTTMPQEPAFAQVTIPRQQPPIIRSAPIKVNANKRNSASSFDHQAHHRRFSAPCVLDSNSSPDGGNTLNSSRSRPTDYTDPKDGHKWRAKYCVLEDGLLYFYSNAEDADSQEAKKERQSSALLADDVMALPEAADLSKSPMASKSCLVFPGSDGASPSGSNNSHVSNYMWEKRVALNCVGAVRSAEAEYGANAFELLAVDDDEDEGYTNKLVLKAPKSEDMNEWLFQFHRSLASFVRDMVDLAGANNAPSYALGDIHHPGFEQGTMGYVLQSPLRSFNLPAYNPRFGTHKPGPAVAALSHGHGRSQLRRRRVRDALGAQSVHSVPTTPMSQSPTQLLFPLSSMCIKSDLATVVSNTNLVTPLKHGNLVMPEPEVQRTNMQQLDMESPPELSAPLSANPPETERPPAPATGGKYVPPHLRNKGADQLRSKDVDGEATKASPRMYVPPHLRNNNCTNGSDSSNAKGISSGLRSLSLAEKDRADSGFASSTQIDQWVVKGDEMSYKQATDRPAAAFKLGGCADPEAISGSILDSSYVPRKASRVGPVHTNAYGGFGGASAPLDPISAQAVAQSSSLQWEIGAVSECGIRESNEDAYLVTNDLVETFADLFPGSLQPTYWHGAVEHQSGLFAIFDGHGGNQAARFAAERLPHFLYEESVDRVASMEVDPVKTEYALKGNGSGSLVQLP
jgi:hypothetical protein